MLNPRAVATNFMLILLAGGTWWVAENLGPGEERKPKGDSDQIDYYSRNIRRVVLNEEGGVKDILVADVMTHYRDDDRTEMDNPVMTLNRKEGNPWTIRSEQGTLLSGGKEVLLHGDVRIRRTNDKGEEFKILTRNAKYVPDTEYAETAEHVLMLGPEDTTSSTGAQVYFKPALKINLLADVRRKHETQ